jgi:hypothetical protein
MLAIGMLMVCVLCLLSSAAYSQNTGAPLWHTSSADARWPALPTFSRDAYAITLSAAALGGLQINTLVPIPGNSENDSGALTIRITHNSVYSNGDRVFRGELLGDQDAGPFVLALSPRSVFAYIEINAQIWQLFASRHEAAGNYLGWIYQTHGLPHNVLNKDYVIPARDSAATVEMPALLPQSMPLILERESGQAQVAEARTAGIHSGNFRIEQRPLSYSVIAGTRAEMAVNLHNISKERHENLTLNIYFALENTTLVSASTDCREGTLSGQRVLNCSLGDFAPGAMKTLHYAVLTGQHSSPRVISTAMIGNLRDDTVINVVADVLTDSDGDGISDFNEMLLGTDPDDPLSVNNANTVIDVMALYTAGADRLYGGHAQTRINQLLAVANQIYADSGVRITLRPVYQGLVSYGDAMDMDTTLADLTHKTHPAFSQVDQLRHRYGADLVMLFKPLGQDTDRCGLANLGGFRTGGDFLSSNERDYAYSSIGIDCPVGAVVAHELGHNMGLTHSHREDGYGGTFHFATGHGVDGHFATVMAYPGAFNTDVRVSRFSSPLLDCLGLPCGVDAGDVQHGADAVSTLNLVRHQIASYFPTRLPLLPDKALATLSGERTDARIALAASVNKGLNFVSSVSPDDMIDVNVSLFVDSRHVGRMGAMYVLATLDGSNFVLLNSAGEMRAWDGSYAGLHPFTPPKSLQAVEYVQIVNAARLGAELVSRSLQIFIAYSLADGEELVYTAEPLQLNVTD